MQTIRFLTFVHFRLQNKSIYDNGKKWILHQICENGVFQGHSYYRYYKKVQKEVERMLEVKQYYVFTHKEKKTKTWDNFFKNLLAYDRLWSMDEKVSQHLIPPQNSTLLRSVITVKYCLLSNYQFVQEFWNHSTLNSSEYPVCSVTYQLIWALLPLPVPQETGSPS